MTQKTKNYIIYFCGLVIICSVFLMGRLSKKDKVEIVKPDMSKYVKAIDSLTNVNKFYKDSILVFKNNIDSLQKLRKRNNDNRNSGIEEIKNFTPDARYKWNDSVLRANGLK